MQSGFAKTLHVALLALGALGTVRAIASRTLLRAHRVPDLIEGIGAHAAVAFGRASIDDRRTRGAERAVRGRSIIAARGEGREPEHPSESELLHVHGQSSHDMPRS